MAKSRTRKLSAESGTFVVNGGYLRAQAHEAVVSFFAPLSGVYEAATGHRPKTVAREMSKRA